MRRQGGDFLTHSWLLCSVLLRKLRSFTLTPSLIRLGFRWQLLVRVNFGRRAGADNNFAR